MNMIEMIAVLRGGHPSRCDFCHKRYNKKRLPIPEEAGEWACTECEEYWAKLRKKHQQGDSKP